MFSLKKRQDGFTIVELLIVIVVIGILATLVVITFTGIKQKANDSQRKTDMDAAEAALQTFYADNNYYPTLAQLNDTDGWVKDNLKGFKAEALQDPKGSAPTLAAAATATQYGYSVEPADCDNTTGNECTNFKISAMLEDDGSLFTKESNN